MLGLVPLSEMQLGWFDPIPWESLGVFTAESPNRRADLTLMLIASILGWYVLYKILEFIWETFGTVFLGPQNEYFKMTSKVKGEYHSRSVSDIHALIAGSLAINAVFFSCQSPEDSAFTSNECANSPSTLDTLLVPFSAGYCIYDLYICIVEIKFSYSEMKDYLFHHIVGCMGAATAIFCGKYLVILAVGNLISETSNSLMNIRWRLLKHKMADHWGFIAASVSFMLVFFFSRVVLMLMLLIRIVELRLGTDWRVGHHPATYSVALFSEFCQFLIYLLQLYWFGMIFRNFYRTLIGGYKDTKAYKDR